MMRLAGGRYVRENQKIRFRCSCKSCLWQSRLGCLIRTFLIPRASLLLLPCLPSSYPWTKEKLTTSIYRKYVLSDPSAFEEPLLDDTITVVVDENGDFISVNHLGVGLTGTSPFPSNRHQLRLTWCHFCRGNIAGRGGWRRRQRRVIDMYVES